MKDKQKKDKKANVAHSFCTHANILDLVARICQRTSQADVAAETGPNIIVDSTDMLVKIWVDDTETAVFAKLSTRVKTSIAIILSRYLHFR